MVHTSDIYFPANDNERQFINFIWRVNDLSNRERFETILPKGTAEIIFNLSDDVAFKNSSMVQSDILPRCIINGINSSSFHLIKTGQQTFTGIQLKPFALRVLFDVPVGEFSNIAVDGTHVCKSLETLLHRVASEHLFEKQVEAILDWFRKKIAASRANHQLACISRLYFEPDIVEDSVKSLSDKFHFSERHLRRLTAEWLGMNTEAFRLYRRYIKALHLLHDSNLSLSRVAYDSGYYDQPHFTRTFRSYTGLTPNQYRSLMSDLPAHIYSKT